MSQLNESSGLKLNPPPKAWTFEETIRLCGFYFTIPFGKIHARNPEIQRIASALNRSANSIAMKLSNLASLDPELRATGRRGLTGASKLDREAWDSFQAEREAWSADTENWLATIEAAPQPFRSGAPINPPALSETEATVNVRTAQGYFRRMILAHYDYRCCVTGIHVPELLIASHIRPWATFPESRLDRSNGLCLATHFDRAFDQGLITFDETLRLRVGRRLRFDAANPSIASEFLNREGQPLAVSPDISPNQNFLEWHRCEVFDR